VWSATLKLSLLFGSQFSTDELLVIRPQTRGINKLGDVCEIFRSTVMHENSIRISSFALIRRIGQ
jgi:hypothetical protein